MSDSRVKPSSQEHVKDPLLFSQTWPQLLRLGVSHSFTSVLIIRKTDEFPEERILFHKDYILVNYFGPGSA